MAGTIHIDSAVVESYSVTVTMSVLETFADIMLDFSEWHLIDMTQVPFAYGRLSPWRICEAK